MFYDENLKKINYVNEIVWDSGYGNFGTRAKQSQLTYYFSKLTLNKKICLINSTYNLDLDKINASDIELVLVNASDHPANLDELNVSKPYLILNSNFNKENYHPYHLFFSAYCAKSDKVNLSNDRYYRVSFINRNPRITRIYLLHNLRQKNYYHDLKINWFRLSDSNGPIPERDTAIKDLGPNIYNEFLNYNIEYPNYDPKTEFDLCSGLEDYKDSCLNIVAESILEDIGYLTEKIYKPIRAGQLFLVQGPPGSIDFLRKSGFDVFDDIIDHSYDSVADWKIRTDLMLLELDRIYNQIDTLYNQTIERRTANCNWLLSDTLIKDCLPKNLL
jgi:hypothetical protein